MKEYFLWTGMILVILSALGNYIFFQSKQLDEPIFLDHYYKQEVYEENEEVQLTFYYLTNKQHPKTVQYAEIDGIMAYPSSPQHVGFWEQGEPQVYFEQEFSHHYIVPVTIDIPVDLIPIQKDETWSFDTINVFFSDQKETQASIGKVEITNETESPEAFNFVMGSGNSDGEGKTVLQAMESLDMEEITIPFSNEIGEKLAIKVDIGGTVASRMRVYDDSFTEAWDELPEMSEEGIFPLSVQKGESVEVLTKFISGSTSYAEFDVEITGTTENGDAFTEKVFVNDRPYFSKDDIMDIIKEKAGDSN